MKTNVFLAHLLPIGIYMIIIVSQKKQYKLSADFYSVARANDTRTSTHPHKHTHLAWFCFCFCLALTLFQFHWNDLISCKMVTIHIKAARINNLYATRQKAHINTLTRAHALAPADRELKIAFSLYSDEMQNEKKMDKWLTSAQKKEGFTWPSCFRLFFLSFFDCLKRGCLRRFFLSHFLNLQGETDSIGCSNANLWLFWFDGLCGHVADFRGVVLWCVH